MNIFKSKYKKMYEGERNLHFATSDRLNKRIKDLELELVDRNATISVLKENHNGLNEEISDLKYQLETLPEYEEITLSFENQATKQELIDFNNIAVQLREEGELEISKQLDIVTTEDKSFNITTFTHIFKYFKLKENDSKENNN